MEEEAVLDNEEFQESQTGQVIAGCIWVGRGAKLGHRPGFQDHEVAVSDHGSFHQEFHRASLAARIVLCELSIDLRLSRYRDARAPFSSLSPSDSVAVLRVLPCQGELNG